ncbi:hypothetical protein EON65_15620, partial [archaeon]
MSFKVSIAIVRDDKLPSNLSNVDKYLVDKHSVYYPPSHYVPEGLTLPPSWLSMLLSPINSNTQQTRPQDHRKSTRYSSPSRRETLWSESNASGQQTSITSTDDEEDSDTSESSIDINDGQDDLIERMLNKEMEREQRAKEQKRLEKLEEVKESKDSDKGEDRVKGGIDKVEEEKHASQKFIALAQDTKPWRQLTQTLNAVTVTQKL